MPSPEPAAWTVEHLRFDGVWRPEPWLDGWRAVKYGTYREMGIRHATRDMDDTHCRDEEAASVRCDELNATRGAVSPPREAQTGLFQHS